eukprot:3721350-Prymnesium_polylepis.1
MFIATLWPPVSQPGSGFMLLPEKRSPAQRIGTARVGWKLLSDRVNRLEVRRFCLYRADKAASNSV